MKILAVLEQGTWVEHHIVGSLRSLGHEVEEFHYGPAVGEFYGSGRRDELLAKNADLVRCARRAEQGAGGLDLMFCYVYDDFLQSNTARELASIGVPMVNFNVDMVNQWYRQARTARYFTAVLCAQKANMGALASYGATTWYFPMAARPTTIKPEADGGSSGIPAAPVTFVGTPMPFRSHVLRFLLDSRIPLAVYGKYWREACEATPDHGMEKTVSDLRHYAAMRLRHEGPGALLGALGTRFRRRRDAPRIALPGDCLHGFLPQDDVAPLFARSEVNIGFTRMTGTDPWVSGRNQVKLRDFEVPMAGGFYLVEEAPDYSDLFEPGVEVETWRTPDELLEKINYYLSHDDERRGIASRGWERANRDHTWQRRFEDLFRRLGISRH
jgi:spore maturation protein CgeB